MRKMPWRAAALLIILIVATACGSAAGGENAGQGAGAGSTEGLEVVFATNPNPATMGQVEMRVDVFDAERKPVEDAKVTFTAGMDGHSMGDLSGPGTPQGNGRYATRANLSMAGGWIIKVNAQDANQNVERTFRFNVQ